jgi:hypothetical protein
MYAAGFITTVAWLVLIAGITLIASLLRGMTEASGWYARLIVVAGSLAAAVTLAGAFVTDGAAYYGATHSYAPDAVAVASVASKFADQISFIATGMLVLAVAGAGLTSRLLPRWASIVSAVVGVIAVVSGASASILNTGTLLWFAWLILIGVVLMRGPAKRAATAPPSSHLLTADLS